MNICHCSSSSSYQRFGCTAPTTGTSVKRVSMWEVFWHLSGLPELCMSPMRISILGLLCNVQSSNLCTLTLFHANELPVGCGNPVYMPLSIYCKKFGVDSTPNTVCWGYLYTYTKTGVASTPYYKHNQLLVWHPHFI